MDLGGVLVEKVLQQVNIPTVAAKLAPELAERLLSSIEIGALKECVFELPVSKVAEDPALIDAISARLLASLG